MAQDGGPDTTAESDRGGSDGDGAGYRRLEGELTTFRAEFEGLAAEAGGDGDGRRWIERGRELLRKAEDALADGKIEQGWYYLHAAKRLEVYGLEAVGGEAALRGEARELLVEAANAPLSWRTDAVRERIANPGGSLREDLTANDLRSAHKLLHEGYQRMHLKRQHLQSQFRYLRIGGGLTVVIFLLVAFGSTVWDPLPSPLFDFASDSSAGGPAEPVGFLVYVVLSGMLGASLFGLRSLRKQPVSTSTPQYLSGFQATVARLVVGAGSALAVFFFVRSELLTVGTGTGVSQGPFLVAVAFVAGYSQRFVHATVESVAGLTGSASDDDGPS